MLKHVPSSSVISRIEWVSDRFNLCRNRVWSIASNLRDGSEFLQIPFAAEHGRTGQHEGHEECTFNFCEHSRLDFTRLSQRHEPSMCIKEECTTIRFDPAVLDGAVDGGLPTAWGIDTGSMIEPPQPFMAISHVWSDGTGAG